MQRGRSSVSLGDLLAAGFLAPGQQLVLRQRPSVTAAIAATGRLRIGDQEYTSPSTAARAVLEGTATNGWKAWCTPEGDALADVRARYLSTDVVRR